MLETAKDRLLLVDDEEGILRALQRLFKQTDAEIMTAPGGEKALEILQSESISMIISDQRMPGMTGVELLRQARDIQPDAIRILLTGYADIEATVKAINDGAVRYYFNKPWDDEFLLSRVAESLQLYRTTQENNELQRLTKAQNLRLSKMNDELEEKVRIQTTEIRSQHEELKSSFMETIKAFSTIIEVRSKEVGSHSQRVTNMVKNVLETMDLNVKEYQDVMMAAYLHDIGKISYPDRLVTKSVDNLSKGDKEIVYRHPILGQSCVYSISGFEEIGVIIRHHHEHFDGSGYPDGLREKKIPFGSRIIRICDAFDHVAFMDGYPDAKQVNSASAALVKDSGSVFDPELVRKFIDQEIGKKSYHDESTDVIAMDPMELKEGMVTADDIHTKNGMFLLPKGARLSDGMISRINKIHHVDPVASAVRVYKSTTGTRRSEHA
ncbi:MAG TPA: HD domain-containing phosphohydrolase, partial [candidate division Zixibacteria bacterium]|nr:HD domain-containing phosphohydrolase [candidate division Zixibacteria bacterium]